MTISKKKNVPSKPAPKPKTSVKSAFSPTYIDALTRSVNKVSAAANKVIIASEDLGKTQAEAKEIKKIPAYVDIVIDDLPPTSKIPVKFYWIFEDGTEGLESPVYNLYTTEDKPLKPNGFSVARSLGGITVSWAGTYSDGNAFSEFKAIKLYAGTEPTTTDPTKYTYVGQLSVDKVTNSLFIPVDKSTGFENGKFVRYGNATSPNPIYIHASSINLGNVESDIVANVANTLIGAGRATDSDISDGAIIYGKVAANAVTVDLLGAGTISATTFIRAGTKNLIDGSGARIELASNTVLDGAVSVLPGLRIYNSGGSPVFSADLGGNLYITGAITATSGNIAKFAIGSDALTHTNSTNGVSVGIYNASQAPSNYVSDYFGGFRVSKPGSDTIDRTSYLFSSGLFVVPTSRDTSLSPASYAGFYYNNGWYINDKDEGTESTFAADIFRVSSGSVDATILLKNTAGIKVEKRGSSYSVKAVQPTSGRLNAFNIRNIYVSSTAGEPTVTGSDGDIKLEW